MIIIYLFYLTLPGVNSQGDRFYYTDAPSLSLGGVTSVLKTGSNPACLGLIDRLYVSITPAFTLTNERRGLRVYDSYGNNMGISTITNSTHASIDLAAGLAVFPLKGLRIGFQYSPMWDFDYYFRREYRDDFYQLTKTEIHEYDGSIYSLAPVVCFSCRLFSVGIKEHFILGKTHSNITITGPNLPDSVNVQENTCEGKATSVGILVFANQHFALAYVYLTKHTLKEKENSPSFDYPATHTIGCYYQPAARIPTRFFGEFSRETWLTSINIYKAGIEHKFASKYAIRYGFCVFPNYEQTAVWTTVLSIGFGLQIERLHFNLGYSYAKRDYTSSDFDRLNNLSNLQFDESTSTILMSLGFTL